MPKRILAGRKGTAAAVNISEITIPSLKTQTEENKFIRLTAHR
jgi:hypothetical protein